MYNISVSSNSYKEINCFKNHLPFFSSFLLISNKTVNVMQKLRLDVKNVEKIRFYRLEL